MVTGNWQTADAGGGASAGAGVGVGASDGASASASASSDAVAICSDPKPDADAVKFVVSCMDARNRLQEGLLAADQTDKEWSERWIRGGMSLTTQFKMVQSEQARNAIYVPAYNSTIFAWWRRREAVARCNPAAALMLQAHITAKMRAVLVDWLCDVTIKFKLLQQTFYLAVSLIDRFLDKVVVVKSKFQLIGATAMLLASKFEEIYAPAVHDIQYVCAGAYTTEDITACEEQLLRAVEYIVHVPTVQCFLERLLFINRIHRQPPAAAMGYSAELVAEYFAERTIQEYAMVSYLPSQIAAAAVYLSNRVIRAHAEPWPAIMQCYTGYSALDLRACIVAMNAVIAGAMAAPLQAVNRKYRWKDAPFRIPEPCWIPPEASQLATTGVAPGSVHDPPI
jgi:hypothetical protein